MVIRLLCAMCIFCTLQSVAMADDVQCVENARQYADEICTALAAERLPLEFSMLAVAESCGKPHAISKRGAAGLWQLMPATARRFGDVAWTVAAYNAGGHNLERATGFRRGLDIEAARVMPEAYALAKAVGWLIRKHGNICE